MERNKKPHSKYCVVPRCTSTIRTAPNKLFFHMPRDPNIRENWCKAMRRDNVSTTSSLYCCGDHFNIEEDTQNYIQYKLMTVDKGEKTSLRLKKGVVPHIFECQKSLSPDRECGMKRKRKLLIEEALPTTSSNNIVDTVDYESDLKTFSLNISNNYLESGPSTSTLMKIEDTVDYDSDCSMNISNIGTPQVDNAVQLSSNVHCRSINFTTRKTSIELSPFPVSSKNVSTSLKSAQTIIKRKLSGSPADTVSTQSLLSTDYVPNSSSESSILSEDESDNRKQSRNLIRSATLTSLELEPKMLLGLPKRSFNLIKLLSESIPLPIINILITLKKIKLNESFGILALQFGYTQSSVVRIFSKSIVSIAEKMKELIVWPTPPEILNKLPISFRAMYADVVSIIECLEIEIEKPSNAIHQSLTWSEYKKCNTLKYLISCTPDGSINFVSEGYGGRATYVTIIKDCGYLDCLPPKKAVMADRSFKGLSCLLQHKDCYLVTIPSVSKQSPNTKVDMKLSQQIAALRIHVERIISRIREFHMLLPHACIDNNLIPVLDNVIIVACGLINKQDVC